VAGVWGWKRATDRYSQSISNLGSWAGATLQKCVSDMPREGTAPALAGGWAEELQLVQVTIGTSNPGWFMNGGPLEVLGTGCWSGMWVVHPITRH
jgi:hypothetical protein